MADTLSWANQTDFGASTTPMTSLPPSPSLTFAPQPLTRTSSLTLLLSLPDLIYYTSHFLTLDELLCCSSLSSRLHTLFDSDKVWRRRLGEAKHIQSSWVPLEIQKPYVHRDDDDEQEEKYTSEEEEKYSLRREEEQLAAAHALLVEQNKRGSFEPSSSSPPPLPLALALCRFYYIYRINSNNHLNCDILPLAILPIPPSINLNTFVPPPAAGVCVYHCRFLLTRDRLVNKSDARELRLAWDEDSRQWQVAAMLRSDSGILALNVHNVRDGRIVVPDEPLPPTLSCKQRYIRLLGCSCHSTTHCQRLLPPSPALPPPRPVPAWFSHHLAQLSIRQQPFPPVPPSPYPSFLPLPVCSGCRLEVKEAVRVFSETWRDREGVLGFEVDCMVRVNEREWDVRWRAYADDVTYRRCVVVAEVEGEEDEEEEDDDDEEEAWRIEEDEDDEQLAEEQPEGMTDTLTAVAAHGALLRQRLAEAAERRANPAEAEGEEKQDRKENRETVQHEADPDEQQRRAARHEPDDAAGDGEDDEEEEDTDEWVENAMQPTDATLQWIYGQLADATTQHYQRLMEEAEGEDRAEEEGEEEKGERREGAVEEDEDHNEEGPRIHEQEDDVTPRPTVRPRANSLPMSDATASSVAASTAATFASSSVSSPSSASTSARRPLFRVERVLMDNDSGVYAINATTNVPWTDPAPRSSFATHAPVLFVGNCRHPLYHHTRSVYRNGEYVCDVCHELHDSTNGGVWHCDHCSYDCCEEKVEEARREQQAAMEQLENAKQSSQYTATTNSSSLSMD